MSELVQFKQKGWTEAINKLKRLEEWGNNLEPELKQWITYYNKFIGDNWDNHGTNYGLHWEALTKRYAIWKAKQGKGSIANLILNGKLKRAATGGAGWFEKISTKELRFGIDLNSVPYAEIHQKGGNNFIKARVYSGTTKTGRNKYESEKHGMPQRPYMMGKNGDLPSVAYQEFKNIIDKRWNQEVNK